MEHVYLIFKSFVDPVFIIVILLLISLLVCLMGKKKGPALIVFLAFILLYGVSISPVANYLSYYLEKDYIISKPGSDKNIDVIVVLGGGAYNINPLNKTLLHNETVTRLIHAIEAYKSSGAKYLVCSGKGDGTVSEAELMAQMAERLGIPKEKLRIEGKSHNTWENALELNKIFVQKNINIGLVTSAYHMKRSEKELRKYFSNVSTLPSNYLYSSHPGSPAVKYIPQAGALYKTTIAVKEMVGQLWYNIKSI